MANPWLSIIIPVYNGEAYLPAALDSIAEQDDPGIEIVAIDDGSSDQSRSILEAYAKRLPIRLVSSAHTGNWVANTNHALSLVRGEYTCFLHQDDTWLHGRLATLRPMITANPAVALFVHAAEFIGKDGAPLGRWTCPLPHSPVAAESASVLRRLLVQNFIPINAPIFKTRTALDLGGLDETLWYTADWDLWLKLAASGRTLYIDRPLSAFRVHPRSQTMTRSVDVAAFRAQLETVVDRHRHRIDGIGAPADRVARVARFSISANTALAAAYHGDRSRLWPTMGAFLSLGPRGWNTYLRDSRITTRLRPRIVAEVRAMTGRAGGERLPRCPASGS